MRVAIATATFPPYRGGQGNVAEMQARLLSELGHEVVVFTAGKSGAQVSGYRVVRQKPLLTIGKGAVLPNLAYALRDFGLVILHYPAFGLVEPVLLWRKLFGRRSRLAVFYHMDPVAGGARGLIFKTLESTSARLLLSSADSIIVSSLDYALSGRLGGLGEKIKSKLVEIPLAVDENEFSPGGCRINSADRFGLLEKNLLFVGAMDRAHYFKGVEIILAAFAEAKVPNLRLHLVGSGELMESYKRRAAGYGLGDLVKFHGSLEGRELIDLYRCADALVLPSTGRSEAFGLVILEAAACGKPAIVSALPGVRTVIRENETGFLVPPSDVSALAEAIKKSFVDPTRLREMGDRARAAVLEKWSLGKLRQELERFVATMEHRTRNTNHGT